MRLFCTQRWNYHHDHQWSRKQHETLYNRFSTAFILVFYNCLFANDVAKIKHVYNPPHRSWSNQFHGCLFECLTKFWKFWKQTKPSRLVRCFPPASVAVARALSPPTVSRPQRGSCWLRHTTHKYKEKRDLQAIASRVRRVVINVPSAPRSSLLRPFLQCPRTPAR